MADIRCMVELFMVQYYNTEKKEIYILCHLDYIFWEGQEMKKEKISFKTSNSDYLL